MSSRRLLKFLHLYTKTKYNDVKLKIAPKAMALQSFTAKQGILSGFLGTIVVLWYIEKQGRQTRESINKATNKEITAQSTHFDKKFENIEKKFENIENSIQELKDGAAETRIMLWDIAKNMGMKSKKAGPGVYAILFFILHQLKNLTRQQKLGACAMFAVGFINLACAGSLLTLSLVHYHSVASLGAYNFIYPFQHATATMVVCMPQARLLVTRRYSVALKKSRNSLNTYSRGSRSGSVNALQSRPSLSKMSRMMSPTRTAQQQQQQQQTQSNDGGESGRGGGGRGERQEPRPEVVQLRTPKGNTMQVLIANPRAFEVGPKLEAHLEDRENGVIASSS